MTTDIILTEGMDLRIGSLYQDRTRFLNYPPFQRDKVWNMRMKHVFIDSILRKLPITACMLMEDVNDEGERIFQVIDGQQRLFTITEFIENIFSTMTIEEAKGRLITLEPLYPGCHFAELPPEVKNRFMDYKMHFTIFGKEHEAVLEEIFLRTNNNQEPLSVGERLFIRNGKARQMALELMKHTFWQTIYTGKTRRKEAFQTAIIMIAIEVFSFPVNLRVYQDMRAPINKLILGDEDDSLSTTLQNTIWSRLTAIEHLFAKAQAYNKTDAIPMYQACVMLDEMDFSLLASQEGCLRDWYQLAKRGDVNNRLKKKLKMHQMDYINVQKDFWTIHADTIGQLPGLVKK